jgi:hypothetical protein
MHALGDVGDGDHLARQGAVLEMVSQQSATRAPRSLVALDGWEDEAMADDSAVSLVDVHAHFLTGRYVEEAKTAGHIHPDGVWAAHARCWSSSSTPRRGSLDKQVRCR